MSDLSTTIVETYRCTRGGLDLSGTDFWSLALDQRAFGPGQLVVVTARRDGVVLGLAHCDQTERPELGLKCCLAALADGGTAAVAYSDEPVLDDPPIGLGDRLDTARAAARQYGVYLVDWMMCDDIQMRSMRITLGNCSHWWDDSDVGLPPLGAPPGQLDPSGHPRHRRRRPRRGPGGR